VRLADAAHGHRQSGPALHEGVTVAEVARAADVSEGTVYNYFPTKEDLFYSQMEAFETDLVQAVRERRGQPAPEAFRRFVLARSERLAAEEVGELIATVAPIISASAALSSREGEIVSQYTDALATLISEETAASADDVEPWVVANGLMGAQRAVVAGVRAKALAGLRGPKLAACSYREPSLTWSPARASTS
jgi:AcrR family transcriptional regulator